MSQVSIGTNGFVWACAFYATVIGTIGARWIMEHGKAIAYSTVFPWLLVQTPIDGKPMTVADVVQSSLLDSHVRSRWRMLLPGYDRDRVLGRGKDRLDIEPGPVEGPVPGPDQGRIKQARLEIWIAAGELEHLIVGLGF